MLGARDLVSLSFHWESYYQLRQRMAFKRSIATNILPLWKRKKPPQFTTEDGKPWRCGRAREFETLRHADCRVCIPLERSLGKRRPFLNYLTFLILFSSFSPQKRRNAALSCGISVVHLFCLHILVRVAGFEPTASWSRTTICCYNRSKYIQYQYIFVIFRTFISNKSTPVYLEMGQFGTRKWVKS